MTTINFSCHLSGSRASVVWKIGNVSILSSDKTICSPEFFFADLICCQSFEMICGSLWFSLKGRLEVKNSLYKNLRLHFYLRDRNGSKICEFSKGPTHYSNFQRFKMLNVCDLVNGKDDTLTIYYELEEPIGDKKETSDFVVDALSTPFQEELQSTFESGKFSDVTLRVGEETFRCHKAILSTHSKVFEAMFDNDMKENRDDEVDLNSLDVEVAKAMLLYIYTNHIQSLSTQKIFDLYIAADKYMLEGLKEKSREFAQQHMSIDNVCEVAEIANLYSDDILTESVERFLSSNLRKILMTEKWKMRWDQNLSFYAKLLNVAILLHECV